MPHLSIARLFEDNREKLRLEWLGGRGGGARQLDSDHIKDSSKGLIGHLNFIHPNLIQVLGPSEVRYLNRSIPPYAAKRSRLSRQASSPASSRPGWTRFLHYSTR